MPDPDVTPAAMPTPPLTVAVATHFGWPSIRDTYASLREQAERVGAEILLVDGSDEPPPSPDELGHGARWISVPGAGITEARMRGYREARAPIIAMTEDHCLAAPDWVDAVLRAHAEHPDAAAIGGIDINGSRHNKIDWASYYAGHAPYMPPLPTGPVPYLNGANVSYKRAALVAVLDDLGGRAIETLINSELAARGGVFYADHRIAVTHNQSRGIWRTVRLHYHAGRNFEGTRHLTHPAGSLQRAVRVALIPVPRAGARLLMSRRKGEPISRLASVTPALLVVMAFQGVGEVVGALTGPGSSAEELH